VRPQRERPVPDVDAEEELELGRYWNALITRWWLPVVGFVAGIAIGYLLSLGGHQVFTAKTTIYLGQPLSPNGTNQIQSLSTNPSAVKQIVLSASAQREAEIKAGLPVGSLRGHVATQAVAGAAPALGRTGQTPLVLIVVDGKRRGAIARAANSLAAIAIRAVSAGYVGTKIKYLQAQVATQSAALKSIDATIATYRATASNRSLSTTDRLILASQLNGQTLQRAQVVDQLAQYQQLLALAKNVEQSKLVTPALAVKSTARSRRNSILVGALIGLVLGILAALLWEPAARVVARPRQRQTGDRGSGPGRRRRSYRLRTVSRRRPAPTGWLTRPRTAPRADRSGRAHHLARRDRRAAGRRSDRFTPGADDSGFQAGDSGAPRPAGTRA